MDYASLFRVISGLPRIRIGLLHSMSELLRITSRLFWITNGLPRITCRLLNYSKLFSLHVDYSKLIWFTSGLSGLELFYSILEVDYNGLQLEQKQLHAANPCRFILKKSFAIFQVLIFLIISFSFPSDKEKSEGKSEHPRRGDCGFRPL